MITKRLIQTLLLFTGFLTVYSSYAQEYNYIHYDVKDGLAGSAVYDLCQVKDGLYVRCRSFVTATHQLFCKSPDGLLWKADHVARPQYHYM